MTVRPTKRAFALAGGALALFGVGTNVQAGWVLVIAALLAGVLGVGALMSLRATAGIVVGRRAPRTAVAGQLVPVTIKVTNESRRMRGLVALFDEFCGTGRAIVDLVGPGETREYVGRRDCARRGVWGGGVCVVRSGGPFGVLRVERTVEISSPIVVYPRTYAAPVVRVAGQSSWRAPAPVGDASSVRDYHPGDPLRHIHWRSSARRGELVVREFDADEHGEVTVVADAPEDGAVADAVASVACSLGLAFLPGAGEIRLIAGRGGGVSATRVRDRDGVLEWGARLGPGGVGLTAVLDAADGAPAIACVCPASTTAVERLRASAERTRVLVVLVGARPDAERSSGALRGAGATVAVVDPGEVDAWFADGCLAS